MINHRILKTGLYLGLLCSQGALLPMATLAKRISASGLIFKPGIRASSQRSFSQLPVPQTPKKLQEASALVKRYYQANKEQCNNIGVATAVGLGTCLLFPVLPKLIGAWFITRGAYRVVASPVKRETAKETAKAYWSQLKNKFDK